MLRTVSLAALLLAAAAPLAAQVPEAAPTEQVLRHLPADADVVVLVCVDELVRTDLWARVADPERGLYADVLEAMPGDLDPGRDLSAAAVAVRFVFGDDPTSDAEAVFFSAMALAREVPPETFTGGEARPVEDTGLSAPVYDWHGPEMVLAYAGPRLALVGPFEDIKAILASEPAASHGGTCADRLRDLPGQVRFAGRVPEPFKQGLRQTFDAERLGRRAGRSKDLERILEFGLMYNLVRMASGAASVEGWADVSGDAGGLTVTVAFDSEETAVLASAAAGAMAEPLALLLPALWGGRPLEAPPETPLYGVRVEGRRAVVSMAGPRLEETLREALAAARLRKDLLVSNHNLHALGQAVRRYLDARGVFPPTWTALAEAGLLGDEGVLVNPALEEHFRGGDYRLLPLSAGAARHLTLEKVVAYERWPEGAEPVSIGAVFADGHVDRMEPEAFRRFLENTLEHVGSE